MYGLGQLQLQLCDTAVASFSIKILIEIHKSWQGSQGELGRRQLKGGSGPDRQIAEDLILANPYLNFQIWSRPLQTIYAIILHAPTPKQVRSEPHDMYSTQFSFQHILTVFLCFTLHWSLLLSSHAPSPSTLARARDFCRHSQLLAAPGAAAHSPALAWLPPSPSWIGK